MTEQSDDQFKEDLRKFFWEMNRDSYRKLSTLRGCLNSKLAQEGKPLLPDDIGPYRPRRKVTTSKPEKNNGPKKAANEGKMTESECYKLQYLESRCEYQIVLVALENMVREHCTRLFTEEIMSGLPANIEAIRILAEAGRVKIIVDDDRSISAEWIPDID